MSEYKDDPEINNETILYVRVHKDQIVPDKNTGELRPSSAVFDDSTDEDGVSGASIVFPHLLEEQGGGIEDAIFDRERFCLVSLTAADIRSYDQGVIYDPKPNSKEHHFLCGPAHGLLCGQKSPARKRNLSKSSIWVVKPSE